MVYHDFRPCPIHLRPPWPHPVWKRNFFRNSDIWGKNRMSRKHQNHKMTFVVHTSARYFLKTGNSGVALLTLARHCFFANSHCRFCLGTSCFFLNWALDFFRGQVHFPFGLHSACPAADHCRGISGERRKHFNWSFLLLNSFSKVMLLISREAWI